MATPKKKHLIELMIEEGVEWQEDAEYAAQNKRDGKVYFFSRKPSVLAGYNHYSAPGGAVGYSYLLPSLCRNWHQTIVTREQYAEAVAAACDKTSQSQESEDVPTSQPEAQYCASVMRQMPTESIESLLAEIKAKREEHDALVAKAEELALEIVGIELQVNDKLNEYGFAMSPLAAPSEPEQPVITDWRDLRVGDVIKVKGKFWEDDEEYTVEIQDGSRMPVLVGGYWADPSKDEFRFIRRP